MALELKRDSKSKASRLQQYNLEIINKAGGLGLVVNPDNWVKVLGVLKKLSEGGSYDRNELGASART